MESWVHNTENSVSRHFDEILRMRRHLHTYPELSGNQHETSRFLYQRLSEAGPEVLIGPEGCGVPANFIRSDAEGTQAACFPRRYRCLPLLGSERRTVPQPTNRNHACFWPPCIRSCLSAHLITLQMLDGDNSLF